MSSWNGAERVNRVVCEWSGNSALPAGTLVVPIKLSGDCFFEYVAVERTEDGYRAIPTPKGLCGYGMHEVDRIELPRVIEWRRVT